MKNTLTRILLLCAALVLAMSLCLVAHAEEEAAEVSTPAYIFWQDSDWWPAVSMNEDDYWAPTPANVTGEGYYTVSVQAHMPSWFYSGGNHNTGAQKLAVVIKDGATLFPGYYMQVTDIRVNGVSYPCGDVTYGQTGYDNINTQDGTVYWDSDDSYGLIYDQWMIDNGGTTGGATWNSAGTPEKFDVFDVSVLNDPSTIEIDFFLSAQQDVKPEGGPALRVIGEGPAIYGKNVKLSAVSDIQLDAWMYFTDGSWWPQRQTQDQSGNGMTYTDAVVTGEGSYTVGFDFNKDWNKDEAGVPHGAIGMNQAYIKIVGGESALPGYFVQITDVRFDGESVAFNNNLTVPFTWDNGDPNDTAIPLYVGWMNDTDHNQWNRREWAEDATCKVLDPSQVDDVGNIMIDFIVTDAAGEQPEIPVLAYEYKWYPDNTMGVAGYSLRDLGIGDKWHNVVPVKLTEDGIYKIPMVASNMYVIGNAIVAVSGGEVTVTYETVHASYGNLVVTSECMKWFASLEEITAEFANDPQSDVTFGQAVSTADLGDVAYLYINNGVTYSQPVTNNGNYLPRYLPKDRVWVEYRAALDALTAPAAEEVPAE